MHISHFISLTFFASLTTAKLHPSISTPALTTLLHTNDLVLTLFTSLEDSTLQPVTTLFEFTSLETKIPCAIVNCDVEAPLCREWDVNAYPAIRLFKSKKVTKEIEEDGANQEDAQEQKEEWQTQSLRYRGPKTLHSLLSFLRKHTLPVLTHIPSPKLDYFSAIDDIVIVAFLPPASSSTTETLLPRFRALAEKFRFRYVFGYVSGDEHVAREEGMSVPGIKVYRNRDGDHWVVAGEWEEGGLDRLLEGVEKTFIDEFREKEVERYMVQSKLTVYIYLPLSPASPLHSPPQITTLLHDLTPLAKQYNQYTTFTLIDSDEFLPMAHGFGLSGTSFPALVVHAPMNDQVFLYREGREIKRQEVEAMLRAVLRGEMKNGQVFGRDEESHDEL